jgi:hypothetical protein
MLLIVTLHSVAVALYLFEYANNQVSKLNNKKPESYIYKFLPDNNSKKSDNTDLIDHMKFKSKKPLSAYSLNLNRKRSSFKESNMSNESECCERLFTLEKVKQIDELNRFTIGKSLWLVWVLLFRAAVKSLQPKCFSSKFLANIWACLCMAFTASYTANLAAFMIIKEEYPNLRGIEDIRLINPYVMNPPMRFGTIGSGSTEEIIKNNHPTMYEYMSQYVSKNVKEGIAKVKQK